ncbi:MAG: molybdate transporter family protein [Chloroflexota bacterium]
MYLPCGIPFILTPPSLYLIRLWCPFFPSYLNLREFAGSMDGFGTLFPLAIGYFAVNGLNPAGLLVMMGLANIVTGIIYHLPLPI